ncbi:MAG TPA: hypothetical protein VI365_09775 [Trebonia sp.]
MPTIALAGQVPLAVTLEVNLHADTAGLGPSIYSVGLPEELAKAIPVVAVALIYRLFVRRELMPRDYLFLGAVSGLVFGASEVVHYFTVNGLQEFYAKVGSRADLEALETWPRRSAGMARGPARGRGARRAGCREGPSLVGTLTAEVGTLTHESRTPRAAFRHG